MSEQDTRFRLATVDDALCIGVLGTQVFLDTYATEGIRPALAREALETLSTQAMRSALEARGARFLLAERAGHLVGFVQVVLDAPHALVNAARPAEIVRLYVLARFAGAGLGTALLAQAEKLCAAEGVTRCWLTAWAGNTRARAFYARRGYADVGASEYVFRGERYETRIFAKSLECVGA